MSTPILKQELDLKAQIAESAGQIASIEGEIHALNDELAAHLSQQARYQLFDEICSSLVKVNGLGATDLFREATGHDPEKQLRDMRNAILVFQQKTLSLKQSRSVAEGVLKEKQASVRHLNKQLAELMKTEERLKKAQKLAYPVNDMPYRVLPWSKHGGDERRFHRILAVVVLSSVAFGGVVPFIRQPMEKEQGMVEPERIARFIKKKQEANQEVRKRLEEKIAAQKTESARKAAEGAERAEDKVAEKAEKQAEKIAEKPTDKIAEQAVEKSAEKPMEKAVEAVPEKSSESVTEKVAGVTSSGGPSKSSDSGAQAARRSAESKGVLAFKNDLANLLKDTSSPKMGADAQISISAKRTTGDLQQRSIIVSQSTGGSGGIDTTVLNRQSEGAVSQRITESEIKLARVESTATPPSPAGSASAGSGGANSPSGRSDSGPRSDEEIQIVFDQYKSALYRIYNRELRSNPSLRGKMVLRIVIEPDGRVSECVVKTSDLASPSLSAAIVERVLKFNFGPKQGAPAITILYPIEFLPPN